MSLNLNNLLAEAMFISDLHLHPKIPRITENFFSFIKWSATRTKSLYILGDFLHVWPGDDAMDAWSDEIAKKIAWLADEGVDIYFMPGNRDFLIGKKFLNKAKMQEISEATIIKLGCDNVLLVHGDRYCTKDRSHQYLRRFTRNKLFKFIFFTTPYNFRKKIVNQIRIYSQNNRLKPSENMLVVPKSMSKHLRSLKLHTVIHGHIHTPGLVFHSDKHGSFYQYILSDWDANPEILCYNQTNNFYYTSFTGDV